MHSGLHGPFRGKLLRMNDDNKAELRNKFVIINEISMVPSKLFYQLYKGLNEIFSSG